MDMMTRRRAMMASGNDEYQKVEYIESHGEEYINTGYVPQNSFEISSVTAFTTQEITGYIGILEQISGGYARLHYEVSGGGRSIYAWLGNNSSQTVSKNYTSAFCTFYFSKTLVKIDQTQKVPSNVKPYSIPFTLFARNRIDGVYNFAKCKQKEFVVKEGGVEIMHLYPCYRKSDGVIGMIDDVSGTFFQNDGSGAFTKGAVV